MENVILIPRSSTLALASVPGSLPFIADIKAYTNYYPFGMEQRDRSWSGEGYRYGYNGMEKDDEMKGEGVNYDYGFRIYDARIARFLSVDPLTKDYPGWSPYPFAMNSPISGDDIDGKQWGQKILPQNNGKTLIQRWVYVKVINNTSQPDEYILNLLSTKNQQEVTVQSALSSTLSNTDTKEIDYEMPENFIKFEIVSKSEASTLSDERDYILEINDEKFKGGMVRLERWLLKE